MNHPAASAAADDGEVEKKLAWLVCDTAVALISPVRADANRSYLLADYSRGTCFAYEHGS